MTNFLPADHDSLLLEPRAPLARPGPIPGVRIADLLQDVPSILRRVPSTTSGIYSAPSTITSCGPKDTTGPCERYTSTGDTTTIPVVLGVLLPLTVALVILLILHRRHVKKLRQEDADDKTKSLDFGMDPAVMAEKKRQNRKSHRSNKNGPIPEMSYEDARGVISHGRGVSIDDLDIANPYILPPGLQQSRESLRSLSRSINQEDDKYRPATNFAPSDGPRSYPSSVRSPHDDSSSFTGSSRRRFDTDSNRVLIKNAQRMSRSGPPTRPGSVRSAAGTATEPDKGRRPLAPMGNHGLAAPAITDSARESYMSTGMNTAIRASNNYLGAYIRGMDPDTQSENQPPRQNQPDTIENPSTSGSSSGAVGMTPAIVVKDGNLDGQSISGQSRPVPDKMGLRGGYLQDESRASMADPSSDRQPKLPHLSFTEGFQEDFRLPEIDLSQPTPYNQRVSSSSSPAPPPPPKHSELPVPAPQTSISYPNGSEEADHAVEDMYEDYYDEDDFGYDSRRSTMGSRPLPPDDPSENPEQRANRIRSFYKEYFDESKTPQQQQHHQHAQPQQRDQQQQTQQVDYYDGSESYAEDYYDEYYNPMPPPPRGQRPYAGSERHRATFSTGSMNSGPRAYSSASGQYRGQGRQAPPKKTLPPPKALHVLPTPHKLKDDLFLPMDFAPPTTYRERRAGTPDSLRGDTRPYSPGLKGANPLASSFDDLAVMPSPHALRKSATFTNLEFALPPRFGRHGDGTASDSGSIRSNRSAMSAVQLQSIRKGAYRVSRIPKEVAGTKDEMQNALRPQWDMRNM